MEKTEKQLWAIIKKANWTKDHNYNRIRDEFKQLPIDVRNQLEKFIEAKVEEVYKRFEKDWLGNPGFSVSDDSYSDLTAEVVGRGEKFFDNISTKKMRDMAEDRDFRESFIYTLHFD
jgi:hypothetical protein